MKTKRENGLGDDIVVSFTFDMPASYDEKALNVVYGNPSSVPTSRYYTKEKSGLDNENKVDVFLPLDGKLELHQEVNIDSIDLTKPVTCKLNYVDIGNSDKPITIEYNHSNEEKITFLKRLSNRQLSFEFDPDWVNRFVSSSLLYKDYSLELSFSLNLSRDIYSESVLFNVISKTNLNPDEKYYESITTELLVPPVNFYSETNELILTKPQMKKPVLSNDGISYINYGKPKTEGNPNHTFGGNKPNDKNEVKLLAPLNFIVELDNDKYPRGKFIGYNSDFEVKMSFGNTSYALDCTPADIQKMIIISSTGTTLTFNIPDDDWKQIVNAKTINESGEGVISFKFKMDVQASEIDKSTRTEVVNIDSSSTPVKVKFNSEEYEAKPQPEPMPEPTTRLVSPYNNGNEISIKLGNPKTPVANPTYSYAATPDKDNNIGLFSPFGFTMELDKGRFANSVFKGISGNPLIEMSISSIGTKRYDHSSSEIAGCVIISGEGKKLDFNLKNTDWNQKVNSASLNSANCTLNISFMIEMETTEKDGTKRSDKVKVETNTLNIKNIKYNAQEYEEVKPEPIPVPKNILVSPKGAGEIVKINLGNPSSAGSPDYTYSNNKPDNKNEISISAPLEFTMEMESSNPNSIFKDVSGNPLIEMVIPHVCTIKYNHPSSEVLSCFDMSRDNKRLQFKLKITDWNQKVNAASLNNAFASTLNISFTIEMETTEKDGSKRIDRVKVENNTLNIKPIKFNAEEYVEPPPPPKPIENGIKYMELRNDMGAVIKFDLKVNDKRVKGDGKSYTNPFTREYNLKDYSVNKNDLVSPHVDVVLGKDNDSVGTRCRYDPDCNKIGRYRITGTTGSNTLHFDGFRDK